MKKRTVAILLAIVLVFGAAVGGTLAWLTDNSKDVVNTFTVGNIDITLSELGDKAITADVEKSFKMIPGNEITKDPKITVHEDSEACWLFVEVVEGGNLDKYISYSIADDWKELAGEPGVYYREVDATTEDVDFQIIKNDTVTVNANVTKEDMDALEEANATLPSLSFKAYAVQKANINNEADAWAKFNG